LSEQTEHPLPFPPPSLPQSYKSLHSPFYFLYVIDVSVIISEGPQTKRRAAQIGLRARYFHLQIKISQWDGVEGNYDKIKAKSFTVQVCKILSNLGAVSNGWMEGFLRI
jgi:hypothetical protein